MNRLNVTFCICLTTLVAYAQNDTSAADTAVLKKYGRVYDTYQNVALVDLPQGGMGIVDIHTGTEVYTCKICDVASGQFSTIGLMEFVYPEPVYVDQKGKVYCETRKEPFAGDNGKYGFYTYAYAPKLKLYEMTGKTEAKYDAISQSTFDENENEIVNKGYYLVEISKKSGLVDSLGKELTPARYDWIDFQNAGRGYAKVKRNGRFGMIDKGGNEAIAPVFSDVGSFAQGLAWVQSPGGKFGYVDPSGKLVIDTLLSYTSVRNFADGMAIVEGPHGIDNMGNEYVLYGYIDKTGKLVIPLTYAEAADFKNGKAKVRRYAVNSSGEAQYTDMYIDKTGHPVK